jgi:hypothetical protein
MKGAEKVTHKSSRNMRDFPYSDREERPAIDESAQQAEQFVHSSAPPWMPIDATDTDQVKAVLESMWEVIERRRGKSSGE